MRAYASIVWSFSWYLGYSQSISDIRYCHQYSTSSVDFMSAKYISVVLDGEKSVFVVGRTTYKIDDTTGFISINASALRDDAYKSYPFVKHLWNLTYDEVKDQVLLNHPSAEEPIAFAKEYCKRPKPNKNHIRHSLESTNLTKKLFCSSVDQRRKGVIGDISFGYLGIPLAASMDAQYGRVTVYDDYELHDGPSDDLKLVWSATINNHTTVDVIPFMEFSTRIYYNTKLDKLNVSSTSSKDFWVFEPQEPSKWGCPL
ncbi:hypothetical protein FOL47_009625 [Perkinsus chesapeaki]|uniref:Uncharacterized protein n=1 Tax=Perkinsus chesapeaki TaxID=330153 RepID=A0A7J6L7A5_PERCH|nr:hypothetical protein FOL47_009625 [Perkinsus chesapeaki]